MRATIWTIVLLLFLSTCTWTAAGLWRISTMLEDIHRESLERGTARREENVRTIREQCKLMHPINEDSFKECVMSALERL